VAVKLVQAVRLLAVSQLVGMELVLGGLQYWKVAEWEIQERQILWE
jgi:hypothetical protein